MEHMIKELAWWLAIVPLIASLIAGLGGPWIGRRLSHCVSILGVFTSFVLALIIFKFIVVDGVNPVDATIFNWVNSGSFHFNVGFLVDHLSSMMLVIVTFVSTLVHIYSIGYMSHEKTDHRFFSYMSAFTFFMIMLVLANNFLLLFFGWEGVGLVSYLLIGYWYNKESAAFGSLKAFLVNRVGDVGFLLGIAAVLACFGTLHYATVFQHAPEFLKTTVTIIPGLHWHVLTLICILLFIGAMGKSAQMPLHIWLPESMEGPTPISALIHAATMVTAGVYMVTRMSPLFEFSTTALTVVLVLGASTCLFCGILGMFAFDIKRVIAYSTLSQLGYMMVGVGSSAYAAGMFHLFTHACFKALLFLSAGSIITAMHEEQDMRKMGGLVKYMPITYACFLVGGLALAAIPPFAGFYSKDSIIEAASLSTIPGSTYAYICVLLGAFVTACYTFRAFFLTFHGKTRMSADMQSKVTESPPCMTIPLILLAIPSAILGFSLVRWILYAKSPLLGSSVFVLPHLNVLGEMAHHFHGALYMALHSVETMPFWFAVVGISWAWLVTVGRPQIAEFLKRRLSWLYFIILSKYGFDDFNQIVFVRWSRVLGGFLYKVVDMFMIDKVSVEGSGKVIGLLSRILRFAQSGYIYQYVFVMMFGLFAFLLWRLLL